MEVHLTSVVPDKCCQNRQPQDDWQNLLTLTAQVWPISDPCGIHGLVYANPLLMTKLLAKTPSLHGQRGTCTFMHFCAILSIC